MSDSHIPNSIPVAGRLFYFALSIALLGYGGYGVWTDDLYFFLVKRGPVVHLSGSAAWIMFAAMLCACVVCLTIVIDHYDKRDNERIYTDVAVGGTYLGFGLLSLSLFIAEFWPT